MKRVAVCDDDKAFLGMLSRAASEAFSKRDIAVSVDSFTSGDVLLEVHRAQPFDVVFLDIDMPGTDGFTAAKVLTDISPSCYIIFFTSHSELVYDSFEFRPLDFIVKEAGGAVAARLERVISRLSENMLQDQRVDLVNKEQGRLSVPLREIVFIESSDHNILYHIIGRSEPFAVRGRISDCERELSQKHFVRVHKKYLVNLRYVFSLDLTCELVVLKTGGRLPMSRGCKQETDRRLTEYLRRETR
ncbi:MAG: response regulator transcription factor [Ruminococcus sp.]|nr:response regulator transcription factor [Ruminococcus sp.]